ncbi:MAG: zinc ABC transporter substrate-binding protein [Planctomycetota bacterium]
MTRLQPILGLRAVALLVLVSVLAVGGCGDGESAGSDGGEAPEVPYTIVATIGMIGDLVEQVAGDRAEVVTLMAAGIDPHLYSPTRTDIQTIQDADVVFYNGLLLEGRMTDALIRAATSGKKVHAVTELIDEATLLEPEEFEGLYDPHVWMDPSAWEQTVTVIEQKLSEIDPEGAPIYSTNAGQLVDQLRELDGYAEDVLTSVPEGRRVLVTAHDAFNYFGERFGYEVVGIQGLSTESEAGVQDIERLVDLLVERDITAVFIESTINPRNVEALVNGAKARGHDVVVGGELFSDAMGPVGSYEGTYVGMIDHNVSTVAKALGGEVPEGGMQGKLGSAEE